MDPVQVLARMRQLPSPLQAGIGRTLGAVPQADARILAILLASPADAPPWKQYRWLREHHPAFRSVAGIWVLTSHAGAATVIRHHATSVDDRSSEMLAPYHVDRPVTRLLDSTMLLSDPPAHDRRRHPVSRSFTPRRVAALEGRVEEIASTRLARLAPRGKADILSEFAYPFTVDVICDLLQVPPAHRDRFPRWANALARSLDALPEEGALARADMAAEGISAYLGELLDATEAGEDKSIVGQFLGGDLRREEIVANLALLLVAGHETTANLIANGLHALLEDPPQLASLRDGTADPQVAVEELLRYAGPVQVIMRVVLQDIDVDGDVIPAGSAVAAVLGAANRDPAVFADPEHLLLDRDPNPHLAFSAGLHSCLGAHLARLEARAALTQILRRLPGLRLARPPACRDTLTIRGFRRLDVAW